MSIVTDTRTAPSAWAVEAVRKEEAARLAAYDAECAKNRGNLHGWSHPTPFQPMREDEIMETARVRQERREAYLASPQGRVYTAARDLVEVGSGDVAASIMSALSRSGHGHSISARECGVILKVLDGMNTSTARAIVQAIADNLRAL